MEIRTVAVQEPRRLFREGLALVLARDSSVGEVITVSTPPQLVALARERKPDAVVLPVDDGDDQLDALRAVEDLSDLAPVTRVIGLHGPLPSGALRRLVRAGATLVDRQEGAAGILAAVRGDASWSADGPASAGDVAIRTPPVLSPRELDVLRLVASGLTTKEISDRLGISPKTIENHKQRTFWKLGVQSQAHAVAVAMRAGLLSLVEMRTVAGRDAG